MEKTIQTNKASFPELELYLALLEEKGAVEGNLIRRRTFLNMLLKDLQNLPATEKVYGALVEEKLRSFGQEELRHFFQVTAREFYWFWIGDSAKIEQYVNGTEKISVNPFRIQLNETLEELQVQADAHFINTLHPALVAYAGVLGRDQKKASARLQVARLLLYVFREFDQQPDMFRAGVSALADKYTSAVAKESFLFIVREFYPVWLAACSIEAK